MFWILSTEVVTVERAAARCRPVSFATPLVATVATVPLIRSNSARSGPGWTRRIASVIEDTACARGTSGRDAVNRDQSVACGNCDSTRCQPGHCEVTAS